MTLDNGIQSVTIDPIPIRSTNPGVNQEFELVVGNDLQFILTFNAQMDAVADGTIASTSSMPTIHPEVSISSDTSGVPDTEAGKTNDQEGQQEESSEKSTPNSPAPSRSATASPAHSSPNSNSTTKNTSKDTKVTTPLASPKKQSRFSRMFGSSPKKKPVAKPVPTTMGIQKAPMTREKTYSAKPSTPTPVSKTFKDMWDGLIGPQGEFGRCYLVASQYENEVYGRPRTFNLTLFNEWGYKEDVEEPELYTMNQPSLASLVPSGNASAGMNYNNKKAARYNHAKSAVKGEFGVSRSRKVTKVKLEPFKIASVQITFMYIPRVTMASPLPTSIKNAVKEFNLVQSYRSIKLDGYLSQEGGDCSYWRRRWFELRNDTLIGHTEDSHKVRNILNLKNVRKIQDVATMNSAEKSELYGVVTYEDRSFSMTFIDGETINFYADNAERKNEWIKVLQIAVTFCTGMSYTWVDRVLAKHAEDKAKAAEAMAVRLRHPAALSAALIEGQKKNKKKKTSFDEKVEVHI